MIWLKYYKSIELVLSIKLTPACCRCLFYLRSKGSLNDEIEIDKTSTSKDLGVARQTLWRAINELNSFGIIEVTSHKRSSIATVKFTEHKNWNKKILQEIIQETDNLELADTISKGNYYVLSTDELFYAKHLDSSACKILMCLRAISSNNEADSPIQDIARITGMERRAVSIQIEKLLEFGIIRRVFDSSKRRKIFQLND